MTITRNFSVLANGAGSANNLSLGGATLGTNALAVSGHLLLEGVTSTGATGTGNLVFSASPTLSGTVGGALTFSGALTLSSALTYGGVALSNSVTGTGSMALSASPTFTGTLTAAAVKAVAYNSTSGSFTYSAPVIIGAATLGAGMYLVVAYIPGYDQASWCTTAIVQATGAANNGGVAWANNTGITISVASGAITVTCSVTGIPIYWSIMRMA